MNVPQPGTDEIEQTLSESGGEGASIARAVAANVTYFCSPEKLRILLL
ncbi:hypothetical protein [Streptomyces gilvosporeus]|nr:hypothetical protein [Streptomyces gilvosporeus]